MPEEIPISDLRRLIMTGLKKYSHDYQGRPVSRAHLPQSALKRIMGEVKHWQQQERTRNVDDRNKQKVSLD